MTHPKAGVIGWPIAHSKSPIIHGHWLKIHNLTGEYNAIEFERGTFSEEIKKLPDFGYVGVNVTLPFKEEAMENASSISDRARQIGAANTLTFNPDGTYSADNTDGIGFLNNLKQGAPSWTASSGAALVLGAGGAARAILSSLLADGTPEIILTNRTQERAEKLAGEFGSKISVVDWHDRNLAVARSETIVNTSSLGMLKNPPLEIDLSTAPKTALVTDIVYNPLQTDLLKSASQLGLQSVDGLGMLLHQAVPGFERWFGAKPTVTETLRKIVIAEL